MSVEDDLIKNQVAYSIVEDLHQEKIVEAKAGDKNAALWLLNEFCETVRNNRDLQGAPLKKPSGQHTVFQEQLLDYLCGCFEGILAGVPPEKALGLGGEAGAPRIPKNEKLSRQIKWCLEIYRLKESGKYPLISHAKEAVARKNKVSTSAIEKAWKNPTAKLAALVQLQWSKEGK